MFFIFTPGTFYGGIKVGAPGRPISFLAFIIFLLSGLNPAGLPPIEDDRGAGLGADLEVFLCAFAKGVENFLFLVYRVSLYLSMSRYGTGGFCA